MLDLNDFYYFVQIVDRGGFTSAARTLGTPKSTLSYRIHQLEEGLGVRLLNRTSRRFGMTDAGEEFYRHAVAMLQQAEQAENVMRLRLSEPSGTVRFTVGVAVAQFGMRDMIIGFMAKYPKVNLVQPSILLARTSMWPSEPTRRRCRTRHWFSGRSRRRRGSCLPVPSTSRNMACHRGRRISPSIPLSS